MEKKLIIGHKTLRKETFSHNKRPWLSYHSNFCGALQGSAIGPLFILLFVNDFPDTLKALALLFVGDVKIVSRRTQNMHLPNFLTVAWDWSKKWDLPINPDKCKYLKI